MKRSTFKALHCSFPLVLDKYLNLLWVVRLTCQICSFCDFFFSSSKQFFFLNLNSLVKWSMTRDWQVIFKPPFVHSEFHAQMNMVVVLLWLYTVSIYTAVHGFSLFLEVHWNGLIKLSHVSKMAMWVHSFILSFKSFGLLLFSVSTSSSIRYTCHCQK